MSAGDVNEMALTSSLVSPERKSSTSRVNECDENELARRDALELRSAVVSSVATERLTVASELSSAAEKERWTRSVD